MALWQSMYLGISRQSFVLSSFLMLFNVDKVSNLIVEENLANADYHLSGHDKISYTVNVK